MKRFVINITLLAGAVLIAVLGCEAVLRYTEFRYLLNAKGTTFPDNYFQVDAQLGVDHSPNHPPATFLFKGPKYEIFTNSLGCFDYERPIKEGYILIVGDSTTWGYTALDDKWATQLERLTGKQTIKCGVTGTGTKHQTIKAQKIIENTGVRPSLIIGLRSDNDFNDDIVFPAHTVIEGKRINTLKWLDLRTGEIDRYSFEELTIRLHKIMQNEGAGSWLNDQSIIIALKNYVRREIKFRNLRRHIDPGPRLNSRYEFFLFDVDVDKYPWILKAMETHLNNIRALQQLSHSNGARFVLFHKGLAERGLRKIFNDTLAKELDYYYDIGDYLSKAANGRQVHHRFDGHWNELGNLLAAEGMHTYLNRVGALADPAMASKN